jgi:serine/threonine protein kinase
VAGDELGIPGLSEAVPIGRGGFATVYRARQDRFSRTVAVKVLDRHSLDDVDRSRFERECQAVGSLSAHPNVATVHEGGFTADGRPYLLMEFFERGSLADRLEREGPIPAAEVVQIGEALAAAVAAAHRRGILHRDIKPANVLVGEYGNVCLADFGIARIAGGVETKSGVVTASIAHAAPEVVAGERPTERSDIYSLGSTLYELLAGSPAFVRDTDESIIPILARVTAEDPPDLRPSGTPTDLADLVERAMAKDPALRHPSAEELGAALHGLDVSAANETVGRDAVTLNDLDAAIGAATVRRPLPAPPTVPVSAAPPGDRRTGRRLASIAAVVLVLAGAAGGAWAISQSEGDDTASSDTTTAPPASTTQPPRATTTTAVTTTSTVPPQPASELIGLTDTDPSHWVPSDYEATQTFQLRVFDSTTWTIVTGFPVTMNGCDTRQISVQWRSLNGSVRPAITSYWDPTLGDIEADQVGDPATEGTMLLNGCEQPAFQLLPSPGTIENLTVRAAINEPGFN